jgi:hypothetical protein
MSEYLDNEKLYDDIGMFSKILVTGKLILRVLGVRECIVSSLIFQLGVTSSEMTCDLKEKSFASKVWRCRSLLRNN